MNHCQHEPHQILIQHKSITILTVYRVCINNKNEHDNNTAYSQQWRHLVSVTKPNPDPRKEILDDLTNRITELRQRQSEIIILLDANEHTFWPSAQATRNEMYIFIYMYIYICRDILYGIASDCKPVLGVTKCCETNNDGLETVERFHDPFIYVVVTHLPPPFNVILI